jgi:class 3 adenylate cyclase/tetratricopeptide (TPR) repeat protein
MNCPRCRHENPTGVKFCGECGVRLESLCPSCQATNPPSNKFCHQCGGPLAAEFGTLSFPFPEAYTPKHLVEKILTSKSALEGERKQVTVLFADLKGSMELLADRDPEEARKILDPVLELMIEAVHRYEGTVNQVMGDGIMALFGAPLAHEDHAVRACYAALKMQESLKNYAEEVRRSQAAVVKIRVGLNSGEVVVRAIGNDLHMDYSAVGQTTHLAARMEQLATPGSIRLTAGTLRLAEGFIQVLSLGPVPIKGLAQPVEAFELLGAAPVRTRWQAATTRALTPFVGRKTELGVLSEALGRAAAGHGQVVALVGEAGMGKSRLLWEFSQLQRTHDWLVLEGGSVSYGRNVAYLPLRDLLKTYFHLEARDDERVVGEKLTARLVALDPALGPELPVFLGLLGLTIDDPQWRELDPPHRRQRTIEGFKRLLLRQSQVQPVIMLVEDLHWADPETQEVLESLIEILPAARILLLVDYRPEYNHSWRSSTYTQLRLDPLSHESAEELLCVLLGEDPSLAPLRRLLISRTEGNPFFLEESLRALVETHVLVGERGAYRLAKALRTIEVPPTIHALLAARIDRLLPKEKALLQTAAVIGKDVPYPLLCIIAEEPEEELRRSLQHLETAEFLYEARLYPEVEYSFRHALTHEVTYGSLLHERRRMLHARIVAGIEAVVADRSREHVERLADHAFRGEVWDKALFYLSQAGAKALTAAAFSAAAVRFEEALIALSHLPETHETLEQAIDLRFELRHALFPLGQPERGLCYLREAETLARTLNDRRRLGWVSAYMSYYILPKDPAESLTFGRSARAIGEELADLPLQVAASYYEGLACYNAGDYRQAAAAFLNAIALLDSGLSQERCGLVGFPGSVTRSWLGISLANVGALDEATAHGMEALRLAEAFGQPYTVIIACRNLAAIHTLRGDLDDAVSLLERGLALARDRNVTDLAPGLTASLGHALVLSGRVVSGLSLLAEAVELNESIGQRGSHSLMLTYFGEAYVLAGRLKAARACARQALTHAREHGERGDEAHALHLYGEVASRVSRSDPEAAAAHFLEALVVARELGMRPLMARCHLGLSAVWNRAAKPQQADEHLEAARELFRDMGMRWPPQQADVEGRHGVPPAPSSSTSPR